MTTVTGFTADRMQEIEDESINSGAVVGSNLILTKRGGGTVNAGSVIGPQGIQGPVGPTSIVVCTSATRPTGGARFEGLMIYETDTDKMYTWDGSAWVMRGQGLILCTSATRPASPYVGMEIYETDTHQRLLYNGVRFDKPWNTPWGLVLDPVLITANQVFSAQVDLTGATITYTAVANRRIRIMAQLDVVSTVATDTVTVFVFKDGAQFDMSVIPTAKASASNDLGVMVLDTPAAGAHTYKLQVLRTGTGTANLQASATNPSTFLIEDIGPNGVPA